MQPFFQGKLDNFCAVYAVINALQVIFSVPFPTARTIFNRTILREAQDPASFQNVLEHKTDYVTLIDSMLEDIKSKEFPQLVFESPLKKGASKEEIWEVLRLGTCQGMSRTSVFRFQRMVPPQQTPFVDHWSVGRYLDWEGLHLMDCSLESTALFTIQYSSVIDKVPPPYGEYLIIPPECIRILSTSQKWRFLV